MLDVLAHIDETRHTGHERNHDAGKRAAGDIAGSEQHAGAFVAFRGELDFAQVFVSEFSVHVFVNQPTDKSADENRAR